MLCFPHVQQVTLGYVVTHVAHTCVMFTLPQVYFDVKVEGQPAGRIVIRLFDDAKTASQRFADLAEEKEGVGYRLSKFDGIFPVSLACLS